MKMLISYNEAVDLLYRYETKHYTLQAAKALVEYLEARETEAEEDYTFQVIAIASKWTEYKNLQEWQEAYEPGVMNHPQKLREYIANCGGELIEFEGGILVSEF